MENIDDMNNKFNKLAVNDNNLKIISPKNKFTISTYLWNSYTY